ncbi:hypothetical protein ACLOJK_022142 [Asimina triloba]
MEIGNPCKPEGSWASTLCGLAFNPSESPHYKVVTITGFDRDSVAAAAIRIFIYSSETGKWWSSCSNSNPGLSPASHYYNRDDYYYWDRDSVALWKGGLHWAGSHPLTFTFHLERECFWETPRPCASSQLAMANHVQVSSGMVYRPPNQFGVELLSRATPAKKIQTFPPSLQYSISTILVEEEEKKAKKKKKNTCSFRILETSFALVLEMGHGRNYDCLSFNYSVLDPHGH